MDATFPNKTSNVLISLITVCLNSERHLEEALNSIISQDFTDFEYIIIDGGSTDGTLEIIRRHAACDDRIRWISEPDDGIANAFNKGLKLTSGDIIGILNSDDRYAPGTLRVVAEARREHPECDVFHGDMIRFEHEAPLFVLKPVPIGENIWRDMPVNHPAMFVTRRGYEQVGYFDESLKVAMDYALVLDLYRKGCQFYYIPVTLAEMRWGGASDTRFVAVRLEVYRITVERGFPKTWACFWFVFRLVLNVIKNILRKFGLHRLMRLHPKFNATFGKE